MNRMLRGLLLPLSMLCHGAVLAGVATDETCRLYRDDDVGGFVTCEDGKAPVVDLSYVLPERKRTSLGLYLTARKAYELVATREQKLVFIDIRTRAEVQYLGMPTVADAHVPYMELSSFNLWDEASDGFQVEPNPKFIAQIDRVLARRGLTREDMLVLLCRSGDRSAKAVELLAQAGFRRVYTVIDGYEGDAAWDGPAKGQRVVNGWRNHGLPWSYRLEKSKMMLD